MDLSDNLQLINTENGVEFLLEDDTVKLIRRALETQPGEVGLWLVQEEQPTPIDVNYGNPLYFALSNPLDLTWINGAGASIRKALSFLPDNYVILNVNIERTGNRDVAILVRYRVDNIDSNIEVVL